MGKWVKHFYDSALGRFTGLDPISDRFPWVSTYNYAENRVPNGIDLYGLQYAPFGPATFHSKTFNKEQHKRDVRQFNTLNTGTEIAMGFTPPGVALDVKDFGQAAASGDGIGMFLSGIGFVPGVGDLFKAVGKGVRNFLGDARKSFDSIDEFGGGTGSDDNIVFRALRADENPVDGLSARAPGANTPIGSHVMGKRDSDLISTTKDKSKAMGLFNSGNGVVEIDLNLVNGDVIDVSSGFGKGRVFARTKSHKEVLIRDKGNSVAIPPQAIKEIE